MDGIRRSNKVRGIFRKSLVLAVISGAICLHGCRQPSGIDIACSFADMECAGDQKATESLLQALEDTELTFEYKDAKGDHEQQEQDIELLLQKSPKYLVVTPVRTLGLEEELEQAREQGTKVILYNRSAGSSEFDDYLTVIAVDACYEGELCAEELGRYFDGREKGILEISGKQGSSLTRDRSTGFRNGLCQYDNLYICLSLTGSGDRLETRDMVASCLLRQEEIGAVFAHTDEDGLGAALAFLEFRRDSEVPVVVIGESQDICHAVLAGCCEARISSPADMGSYVVKAVTDNLRGEEPGDGVLVRGACRDRYHKWEKAGEEP